MTSIDPDTTLGPVRLTVGDLDRMVHFYERTIGLPEVTRDGEAVRLGPKGGGPLVQLEARPQAPPRPPGTTGLFHLAVLVPSRPELALALTRVVDAGTSFTGASDHLVSEALYLNDPEGNGIEIYRDRPREEWTHTNGQLDMATLPLNVDSVIRELPDGGRGRPMSADTRMGHVHLQVADLAAAEDFYAGGLGFDVTVRGYPGALFLSAGGYHHHVGLNTWAGENAPPPPPGARGLRSFQVLLPNEDELSRTAERLRQSGRVPEQDGGGLTVADPSGNRVLLTT